MEVKCQDWGKTLESTKNIKQISSDIYLDKSKNIASEISEKSKAGCDLTQTILNSENKQTKRRKALMEEFILRGDSKNYSFCDVCYGTILNTFETAYLALENERNQYVTGLQQLEGEISK